jgi:hypothetical protein
VASAAPGGFFGGLFSSSGNSDNAKSSGDQSSGGVLDKMSRMVGLHGADQPADAPAAKPKPAAKPTQTATASTAVAKPKPQPAAGQPDSKSDTAAAKPPAEAPTETASNASLLRGAQATLPSGSFDSRWGAMH